MTMVYNGFDQRASVTVATSATATPRVFIYDGSNRLIGEYGTSTKTIYAEHVWLTPDPDEAEGWQPLALVGPKTTSWVTGDHLGTPAYLSSATGTVVNAYEATPFGGRWRALVSNPTTALGQPGQIEDDITFRAYNLHRDYDPSLGRYIEADPIGLAGSENVYGYAGGNPVGRIDPSGLQVALPIPVPLPLPSGSSPDFNPATAPIISPGELTSICRAAPQLCLAGAAAQTLLQEVASGAQAALQKTNDYNNYKDICNQPPPPGLCGDALKRWKLNKAQKCLKARQDYTNKYYNGVNDPGHQTQIDQLISQITRLISELL